MTAVADPTMQLIDSLDDPKKFERKDRVAVFKPHTRDFPEVRLADGTVIPAKKVEVTDKDLPEIAANTNKLYGSEGQLVKLTVGHRKYDPAFAEKNQPSVVGYARNYKAEVVDRPYGKCLRLTHTEYIHRDKPQSAAVLNGEYPERSPEYDPERKIITGVALLTRDQALPLGTVSYEAGSARAFYQMGTEAMNPDMNTPGDEEMNDAEKAEYAKFCKFMKAYSAMTAAGPGNASPAAPMNPAAPAPYQDPAYLALQAEIERERQATAEANRQATIERCRNLLNPMKELRKFDYQRELSTLVDLPDDAARGAHVHYMFANYLPLPTGGMIRVAETKYPERSTPNDPTGLSQAPKGHAAACHYMSENPGVSYEDAVKKVGQAA